MRLHHCLKVPDGSGRKIEKVPIFPLPVAMTLHCVLSVAFNYPIKLAIARLRFVDDELQRRYRGATEADVDEPRPTEVHEEGHMVEWRPEAAILYRNARRDDRDREADVRQQRSEQDVKFVAVAPRRLVTIFSKSESTSKRSGFRCMISRFSNGTAVRCAARCIADKFARLGSALPSKRMRLR